VAHGAKEWARDDDGDGVREVPPTLLRACGQAYATSNVPFVACTRSPSQAMSLFMNAGSTSNVFLLLSSLLLLMFTLSIIEPKTNEIT